MTRHGPRFDVANEHWHLTTPTPYDPPLTYGGWKNSTNLGVRIASLLYAREQSLSTTGTTTAVPAPEGVQSHDFAAQQSNEPQSRKRKRRTHKVVIHTSPFLRCVQTSVAIAAGISQFSPPGNAPKSSTSSRARTPNHFSSLSARSSVSDHNSSTGLLAVPELKAGLAQEVAQRVVHGQRHKRVKLRVDAFLGEWLNPEYYQDITPPPPSAMMVATAKAELMQNDTIDVYTPSITHKSSRSSLWGGASAGTRPQSRDGALEDWDDVHDSLPPPSPRRDRTSSHSSVASSDSAGSRIQPYRFGQGPQSFLRAETTAYTPPMPTYAISTSDRIPKGYVAHAKNNCTNIDFHWDSSRLPQDWGDGGEYGEEWSLMQRRIRRGLTQMTHWYSQHNADDRGEDALGLDQAEHHDDDLEEQEDLVVILVTHSACCNALIGALTGQPVLLDVGTASLTMGIRRDDAPVASGYTTNGDARRGSLDIGLTTSYDLKIIADSTHLRPGYDPFRSLTSAARPADPLSRLRPSRGDSMPGASSHTSWSDDEHAGRGSMSTAIGSIRRPHSSSQVPKVTSAPAPSLPRPELRGTLSSPESVATVPSFTGLWTPPAARTPQMQAKYIRDERREIFSSLNESVASSTPAAPETGSLAALSEYQLQNKRADSAVQTDSDKVLDADQLREQLVSKTSTSSRKGSGHKVLWAANIEDHPVRNHRDGQKRRWTLQPEEK